MNHENLQFALFVGGIILGAVVLWYFGNVAGALALVVLLAGQQLKSYSDARQKGTNPIIQQQLTEQLQILYGNLDSGYTDQAVKTFNYMKKKGLEATLRKKSKKLVKLLTELSLSWESLYASWTAEGQQTVNAIMSEAKTEISNVLAE